MRWRPTATLLAVGGTALLLGTLVPQQLARLGLWVMYSTAIVGMSR